MKGANLLDYKPLHSVEKICLNIKKKLNFGKSKIAAFQEIIMSEYLYAAECLVTYIR